MDMNKLIRSGIKDKFLEVLNTHGFVEVTYLGEDDGIIKRPGYLPSRCCNPSRLSGEFNLRIYKSLGKNCLTTDQPFIEIEPDKIWQVKYLRKSFLRFF